MRLRFIDSAPLGSLGKLERTTQGGYRVPAKVARAGVLPYTARQLRQQGVIVPERFQDADVVNIYTPPEALEAALKSLQDGECPVTDGHPKEMVHPGNYEDVVRGSLLGRTATFDGTYLSASLALQAASLIQKVDSGKAREVSMGYYADIVFEDGIVDGTPYHARRTELEYNHGAVVPYGRAGAQVCLALDSMEIPTEEDPTVKLKIKGVELDATQAQAAIDALEAELAVANKGVAAGAALLGETELKLKTATSDEAFEAKVKEREEKAAAEKARADKLKVVKDAGWTDEDLKDKSPAYVDGLYDNEMKARKVREEADPDGLDLLQGRRGSKQEGHAAKDAADRETERKTHVRKVSARDKMIATNRARVSDRGGSEESAAE